MINFDFYTPTRVLFGADRENEAGKQVAAFGGHKVMIIYGKKGGHVESSGLLERVHQSLNGAGLSYIDFSGVVPNPRLSLVKEGIRIGRSEGVDFLLPIGGGSVIDTAKGIGYGIANDFEMEDLLYGRGKTDKNLPGKQKTLLYKRKRVPSYPHHLIILRSFAPPPESTS